MTREDAKDLTLSVLVIVAVLLLADCIWLHVKQSRSEASFSGMEQKVAGIAERLKSVESTVEKHHTIRVEQPAQQEQSFAEQAKEAYSRLKTAAAAGYQAAKEEYNKK